MVHIIAYFGPVSSERCVASGPEASRKSVQQFMKMLNIAVNTLDQLVFASFPSWYDPALYKLLYAPGGHAQISAQGVNVAILLMHFHPHTYWKVSRSETLIFSSVCGEILRS